MTEVSMSRMSLIVLMGLGTAAAHASPETEADRKQNIRNAISLDRLLLDDVTIGSESATPDTQRPNGRLNQNGGRLDAPLGQGKDVEFGEVNDPVTRISQQMTSVGNRIAQQDTSGATQDLQLRISRELASMIGRAQRQRKMSASHRKNGPQPTPRDSVKQPKDPSRREQLQENVRPQESVERFDSKNLQRLDDSRKIQVLIKQLWGHLPSKVQDEMINSNVEKFLPQYEELIIEYFRRLAEEGSLPSQ